MKCNISYFEIHFLLLSNTLLVMINIQCSWRSAGFNVAYFLIVDLVVMATLTALTITLHLIIRYQLLNTNTECVSFSQVQNFYKKCRWSKYGLSVWAVSASVSIVDKNKKIRFLVSKVQVSCWNVSPCSRSTGLNLKRHMLKNYSSPWLLLFSAVKNKQRT